MARISPHVISARVTAEQLSTIRKAAAARNESISTYVAASTHARSWGDHEAAQILNRDLRAVVNSPTGSALAQLVRLTAGNDPHPDEALGKLLKTLGLPDTATSDEILHAVQALLDSLGPTVGSADDPAAQGADPSPAPPGATAPSVLSAIRNARARSEAADSPAVAQAKALIERAAQGFPGKQGKLTPQEQIELSAARRLLRNRGRGVSVSIESTDQILHRRRK